MNPTLEEILANPSYHAVSFMSAYFNSQGMTTKRVAGAEDLEIPAKYCTPENFQHVKNYLRASNWLIIDNYYDDGRDCIIDEAEFEEFLRSRRIRRSNQLAGA
jgi:hypothetical protein